MSKLSANQPKNINHDVRFTEKVVKDGLRNVASHHVQSFNYTFETCLSRINQYMLTSEVTQPPKADAKKYPFNKMSMWFEDFELKMPQRSGS
jgi:DNA-directed RNA polymerase I subunit RPA2